MFRKRYEVVIGGADLGDIERFSNFKISVSGTVVSQHYTAAGAEAELASRTFYGNGDGTVKGYVRKIPLDTISFDIP